MTPLQEYFATLTGLAMSAVGRPVTGTVLAPAADRDGARSATSYPLPSATVVWCDPAVVGALNDLLGDVADQPIDSDEFVRRATAGGATLSGFGNNRVLIGDVDPPVVSMDAAARVLDRNDPDDIATLARFAAAASEDDLDEADLDLDALDPFIVGLFDGDTMVAYGSGRPYGDASAFDDIGVLTHPAHRRRGLGAHVVAEFIERRIASDPTRRMLYRCNTENAGSNGVAESLGFTLAHTIGAVRFPTPESGRSMPVELI